MTFIGKMMAILVLILSITQFGLTVFLYATRSKWSNQVTQAQDSVKVASANVQQFQADLEKERQESNARVAALNGQINKLTADVQAVTVIRIAAEKELADKKVELDREKALVKAAQADVQLRQADTDRTLVVIKDRDEQIKTLVASNKKEREDRVNAEIGQATLAKLNVKLEDKLRESMKELVKSKQPSVTSKTNAENPPLEKVEGLVSEADASGLIQLTIGSDAGLKEGNTLQAYRIAPNPQQSQYLGMVRIRTVTPTTAVAEPVGKMTAPLQRGDYVSSRISGG